MCGNKRQIMDIQTYSKHPGFFWWIKASSCSSGLGITERERSRPVEERMSSSADSVRVDRDSRMKDHRLETWSNDDDDDDDDEEEEEGEGEEEEEEEEEEEDVIVPVPLLLLQVGIEEDDWEDGEVGARDDSKRHFAREAAQRLMAYITCSLWGGKVEGDHIVIGMKRKLYKTCKKNLCTSRAGNEEAV